MTGGVPWWRRLQHGSGESAKPDQQRRNGLFVTAVLVILPLLALSQTLPWRLAEARIYDYLSTMAPPPRPESGPVIVAIDEPSLAEIGLQWPWPRDLHARLVKELRKAGAKAIGLDIIFAEPTNPAADAALASSLGPDVVLAADDTLVTSPHAEQAIRVEPLPEFAEKGARIGVASIVLDGDGLLRKLPAYPDGFARQLLAISGQGETDAAMTGLLQAFGGPRLYPTASYYQALEPDAFLPEGFFRDRVVIVGLSLQNAPTTESGGADAYATSYTVWTGRLVSGAEIQATIFDNLDARMIVVPAAASASAGAVLAITLIALFATWRSTGWRTVVTGIAVVGACGASSFLLLRFGRIYLAPLSPALAFMMIAAAQGARDYAAERRLRQNITRAFSQYLSPVLVERLASEPAQLKLGGERKTLTVLFSDVRGFTAIAEGMKDEPERLTTLVNRLLNPLSQAILAEGGTIDKYMGDCVMAFWNAPLDDPDHAVKAVRAGLAMLVALEQLNGELAAEAVGKAPMRLGIGIGINTGDCIVGNMGSDLRFDYSAVGDAVNLASRLEAKTRDYEVPLLIGPETARLVGERYPVVELDKIAVKGKTEIVSIATVLPDAPPEALARHQLLRDDSDRGLLMATDSRFESLAAEIPALSSYYSLLADRASARAAAE